MNSEWEIPDPSLPVRQGDLLISRDPKTREVQEMCIVLTADCDISKGKFGRQLACLRVQSLEAYIRTIWAGARLQKAKLNEAQKLRDQLAKWHSKMQGSPSQLTVDAALKWIAREEPDKLCDILNVPLEDRRKFTVVLQRARNSFSLLENDGNLSPIAAYAKFLAASREQDVIECRQEILRQAQNSELPEDVFLLSCLPQISSVGAVILLRDIVGISDSSVCFRAPDAISEEMFLRIGRLRPTFKYAVTQSFGNLYSKIGLPPDYEARCKEAIDTIKEIEWE